MSFSEWAESFEFDVPAHLFGSDSMSVCDAILPKQEQRAIVQAAHAAFDGMSRSAEVYRAQAGYDRCSFNDNITYGEE